MSFMSVETLHWVSTLRHPITACHPCQGCRRFTDTGGFLHPAVFCFGEAWAGGSQQQGARLSSAGQQGCTAAGMQAVCSPVAPLAEAGGLQQPTGTEPVRLSTWGDQQWFMTAKVCYAKSLFIQENKQFRKKASALEGSHPADLGPSRS